MWRFFVLAQPFPLLLYLSIKRANMSVGSCFTVIFFCSLFSFWLCVRYAFSFTHIYTVMLGNPCAERKHFVPCTISYRSTRTYKRTHTHLTQKAWMCVWSVYYRRWRDISNRPETIKWYGKHSKCSFMFLNSNWNIVHFWAYQFIAWFEYRYTDCFTSF